MSKRILIVESNKTFLKQIGNLFKAENYEVSLSHEALDAYKAAVSSHYDLVFSNLQLPKVTGIHLVSKIREKVPETETIFLCYGKRSLFSKKVIAKLREARINHCTLPFNKAKLLEAIAGFFASDDEMIDPLQDPIDDVLEFDESGETEEKSDTSVVDTDKFDVIKIKKEAEKRLSLANYTTDDDEEELDEESLKRFEASKALAEITQEAEENLSNLVSSEEDSQVIQVQGVVNYLAWWGFRMKPFSNTPDSRFYFNSKQHSEAITRLVYAVDNMEGLAVLIGKIGAGKTTLARRMLESLDPENFVVALMVIIHSAITPDWLLRKIALQLGVKKTEDQKLLLIGQLYQRLVEIYEEGKKAVILIDEAQMLQTRELMEEFRGLLNLEVPGKKLLTFVFFGLEELDNYLALDEPLKQRIALKYSLNSFDRPSARAYIIHRLKIAGVDHPIFSEDAVNLIFEMSKGTPRVINTLANNALLEGFFLKKRYIDQNLIRQIGTNLGL